MNFKLKTLPYQYNQYEPYIAAEIMQLHYEKHYNGYATKLNQSLADHPQFSTHSLENLLTKIDTLPQTLKKSVQNNGGGASNHEIFGEILEPIKPSKPSENFKNIISQYFGSFDEFKKLFIEAAATLFGSGGAGLVLTKDAKLKICTTPNQDSPLMHGDQPILGIDVGEHAYYLQFKNLRNDYLSAIGAIINGQVVEEKYSSFIGVA